MHILTMLEISSTLHKQDEKGGWTYVIIAREQAAMLGGKKGFIAVRGEIDGYRFKSVKANAYE